MVISSPSNDDCVIIDSDEVDNESEILHIDHPSDVALGVSEYTHDIYKYLRQAEVRRIECQSSAFNEMRMIALGFAAE